MPSGLIQSVASTGGSPALDTEPTLAHQAMVTAAEENELVARAQRLDAALRQPALMLGRYRGNFLGCDFVFVRADGTHTLATIEISHKM